MNGSRANPNAPHDPFQDFDIVYIVTYVAPFRKNATWIERFGELMILQMPEDMQDPPPREDGGFTYLMQFTDGNRIDLGLCPLANRLRSQMRATISRSRQPSRHSPTAATNSGGFARTWPRVCGGRRSLTPSTCRIKLSGSSS